jgi:hypothetical protein
MPASISDFPIAIIESKDLETALTSSPTQPAVTANNTQTVIDNGGNRAPDPQPPAASRPTAAVYSPDGIDLVFVQGNGGIKDFYIGKFEITQAQWQSVMGNNPSMFKGENLPVENISWHDAQEFISRLNKATGKEYRLPTEEEWDYAARGGNKSIGYTYSGSEDINDVAWHIGNSNRKTNPVGAKKPNELGIHDMSGNVWEWCENLFSSGSTSRTLRGGSWFSSKGDNRITNRSSASPNAKNNSRGLRVVLPK